MAYVPALTALVIVAIIFISIFAGLICLQVFLSKRENKFVGLILPIVSLVMAIMITFGFTGLTAYNQVTSVSSVDVADGEEVTVTVEDSDSISNSTGTLVVIPFVFILANIPTIVYFAIYLGCHRRKNKNELAKMSIQDLN